MLTFVDFSGLVVIIGWGVSYHAFLVTEGPKRSAALVSTLVFGGILVSHAVVLYG